MSEENATPDPIDDSPDYLDEKVRETAEQDEIVRQFEVNLRKLQAEFDAIEDPTSEHDDQFVDQKIQLRRRLVQALGATFSEDNSTDEAIHRNLMRSAIETAHMRSQVTQDALEEFQERLRRRDEALQKPVDEHDQIDRRRIQFLTSLLTEINFIDTICNSHMSLAAYKDRIVDTMIAKHFDRVVTKP